jgi:hypothetical protein
MKRDLNKWSLVIAGRWNTAILSPDWLAREVFKQEGIKIVYPVLGGTPPIFEAADMRIVVSNDRIVFFPLKDSDELLSRIETAGRHVLTTLPHTPISAFGQNFSYMVEGSQKQFEEVLIFSDATRLGEQGKIGEIALVRTIDLGKCRLNLKIVSGQASRIDLNYHYEAGSASQATEVMENSYTTNRAHGLELLKAVYGLTLDEEKNDDDKPI